MAMIFAPFLEISCRAYVEIAGSESKDIEPSGHNPEFLVSRQARDYFSAESISGVSLEPFDRTQGLEPLDKTRGLEALERQEEGMFQLNMPSSRRNGSPGRTRTCNLVVNPAYGGTTAD